MLETSFPSHIWVARQQAKCFVRSQEKAVSDFGTCFRGQEISLIIKVEVGLGANNVRAAHRVLVLFSR